MHEQQQDIEELESAHPFQSKQEIKLLPSSTKSSREVGESGREVGGPDQHQGIFPQNEVGTELNSSVICLVLKAMANDMRLLALCHDEFRGP
ncbi:hypothetical protein TNCV_4292511 [Trichonephila clavipes]|uniref:Uncharacterized protein n=1 Tax=Trichonephila clavipes TaxID=2585209 RepID=A0A8X6RMG3_TRICX|nr:hypothetical protein TNCV_4292511 [Trichonephila clavipes]